MTYNWFDAPDAESIRSANTAVAETYHYSATEAPFPLSVGTGIPLVSPDGSPTVTPSQEDWDNFGVGNYPVSSALLSPGVWLMVFRYRVSPGNDVAGVNASVFPAEEHSVPDPWVVAAPATTYQWTTVLDAPSRYFIGASSTNDDETRTLTVDLWTIKLVDLA